MIRLATDADIPRLLEMATAFVEHGPYQAFFGVNTESLEGLIRLNLELGAVLVYEHEGRIVGMIGIACGPHKISGDIVAEEVAWWTEQNARGMLRVGTELLKSAKVWACAQKAVMLQMAAPVNSRVGPWLERQGFQPVETQYVVRLTPDVQSAHPGARPDAPSLDPASPR